MMAISAPAVGDILQRLSKRFMARMEESAALAERCFIDTNSAAQKKGWILGPLNDANEDVTPRAERRVTLKFSVINASTGEILSQNGTCQIILSGKNKARRVHSFFETLNGSVKDIYLETNLEESESEDSTEGKRSNVVDAEIVSKKD